MSRRATHSASQRIDAIVAALEAIRDMLATKQTFIAEIAAESGLDPGALQKQLDAWLDSIDRHHLEQLVSSATRPLGRGRVLTLAPGNLPIVAAECLILGVLAGVRHQLALSTRASGLTRALESALRDQLPGLDKELELLVWRELDSADRVRKLRGADRVVAYGNAETIDWIAVRAGPHKTVVPHGPSLAVAWIEPDLLSPESRSAALHCLARDLAAFDQRGCRSPHILFVVGSPATADALARELAEDALPAISERWPRGALSDEEIVDLFMDRLTSESLGRVIEGDGWRITLETDPRVARPSPLGRTIRVYSVRDAGEISSLLETLPAPVGCFATPQGVAPPIALHSTTEVVPLGQLQQPLFDHRHDGRHRLDELLPLP